MRGGMRRDGRERCLSPYHKEREKERELMNSPSIPKGRQREKDDNERVREGKETIR